ncbi:MAG TPA: ABC transporter permease [Anaerolineales bacterium]|nr:ABC transporter permease [Anaerolineales bacterium]
MTADLTETIPREGDRAGSGALSRQPRAVRRIRRPNPASILGYSLIGAIALSAVFADVIAPVSPWKSVDLPFQAPGSGHLFGTDDLGRDVFSGVVHGARTSLIVAMAAVLMSNSLGILLGLFSGYSGGWIDDAVMRFTEFFQVMPRFFLALIAIALFQPGLPTITLVLGLTSWTTGTRLLRAQVLSAREREFVLAARALGAGHIFTIRRHILPNTITPIIVHGALMVGRVMLTEASLAFLGLGDPNNISWGYMLSNAQPFLRTAWWMALFPGLALSLAVLGFNLAGDGLRRR